MNFSSYLSPSKADALAKIGTCIACLFLSFYVATIAVPKSSLLNCRDNEACIMRMLRGKADKPFVYRILVPSVANFILALTPRSLEHAVDEKNKYPWEGGLSYFFMKLPAMSGQEEILQLPDGGLPWCTNFFFGHAYAIYVVLVLWIISLLAYAFGLYLLSCTLFPKDKLMALAAPVMGIAVIVPFLTGATKIYDFTQLMFVALCLYALAKRKFPLYIFLFTASCFNKETTIFLTLFFAAWFYNRMSGKGFWGLLALQIVLFAAIKLSINHAYQHNYGHSWFLQSTQVTAFISGYSLSTLIHCFIGFLLMTYRWQDKPLFLRHAPSVLFIPQFLAYFFFCTQGEYRNFFEIFPILTLLGTHTLLALSGLNAASGIYPADSEHIR